MISQINVWNFLIFLSLRVFREKIRRILNSLCRCFVRYFIYKARCILDFRTSIFIFRWKQIFVTFAIHRLLFLFFYIRYFISIVNFYTNRSNFDKEKSNILTRSLLYLMLTKTLKINYRQLELTRRYNHDPIRDMKIYLKFNLELY